MLAIDSGAAELRMLPIFEIRRGGRLIKLPNREQRVIAFLAIHGGPISRCTLAERLWPDVTRTRACASLRATVWGVSRSAWSPVVASADSLALESSVGSDFRAAQSLATSIVDGSYLPVDGTCVSRLSSDLLPDWEDEWLAVDRERYRQLRLHALDRLCILLAEAGRFADAVGAGLASVASDPTRESAHRALMRAHLLEGNRSEAIRHYHFYRRIARTELGIGPSSELQRLLLEALDDGLPQSAASATSDR
jgi:DNA-binding SARP family transcriptional activator